MCISHQFFFCHIAIRGVLHRDSTYHTYIPPNKPTMGRRAKRKRRSSQDVCESVNDCQVGLPDKVECLSWLPGSNTAGSDSPDQEHRTELPLAPIQDVFSSSPDLERIWETLKSVNRLHIPKDGTPTPIQAHAWRTLLPSLVGPIEEQSSAPEQTGLIALSPTGSGKTLAFGLALAYRCLVQRESGLVLCITRELCVQTGRNIRAVVKAIKRMPDYRGFENVNLCTIYGGISREEQQGALDDFGSPGILVTTTGRLLDVQGIVSSNTVGDETAKEKERKCITRFLQSLSLLVIDEADRMAAHKDLMQQVDKILPHIPKTVSKVFASATWPSDLVKWKEWMWGSEWQSSVVKKPCKVILVNSSTIRSTRTKPKEPSASDGTSTKESSSIKPGATQQVIWAKIPSNISQTVHVCSEHKKPRKLMGTLQKIRNDAAGRNKPLCIVFFATIKTLQYCAKLLTKEGFSCLMLHSHMPQQVRERNIETFCSGKASLLLATDVCARGIHVNHIRSVVQYDFPGNIDQYIHRCGVSKVELSLASEMCQLTLCGAILFSHRGLGVMGNQRRCTASSPEIFSLWRPIW